MTLAPAALGRRFSANSKAIREIRALATRELTRRGRGQLVSVLLEELPTATGTRMQGIINQLSASGDPRAVEVLVARFRKAPPGQGRPFVQAIAQNGSAAAAEALFDLYAGPEVVVTESESRALTTRNYLPTLFLNLRGSERVIVRRFLALPALPLGALALGRRVCALLLDLLHVGLGHGDGVAEREQVVTSVAGAHGDDVTDGAELLDLTNLEI